MAFKISVGLLAFTYSSVLALHPVGHSSLIRINNRKTTSSFQSWLRTKSSPAEDNKLPTLVESNDYEWISPTMFSAIAIMLSYPFQEATADSSSYGILAGRTASMLHPISNFGLFFTSLYSAYLGFQWRRLRDIGEELKILNAQLPEISTGKLKSPISASLSTLNSELSLLVQDANPESEMRIVQLKKDISVIEQATEIDSKIISLSNTRKSLLTGNLRDKHFLSGSLLLGVGVTVSLLGAFNTYMRAGRLFPGPHLYAGMAITILWAGSSLKIEILNYTPE